MPTKASLNIVLPGLPSARYNNGYRFYSSGYGLLVAAIMIAVTVRMDWNVNGDVSKG